MLAEAQAAPRQELALIALAAVCMGAVSLVFPFGRDQGNYAYAAWVWLEGAVPYRDVFVLKPPATLFVHALAQLSFGHDMIALRLFDVLWQALTAACVALLARRMFGAAAAVVAGVSYPFLCFQHDFWSTAQTDAWVNLPIVVALLLASGEHARERWLAGVAFGVALLFKYTNALALVPIGLWALRERRGLAADARAALVFGAGGAFVLAACVAWLVSIGAWPAFVECQTELVPGYVLDSAHASYAGALGAALGRMLHVPALQLLLAAWGTGLVFTFVQAKRRDGAARAAALTLGAWLVVALLGCAVQRKFFYYHYLPLLAPCALAAGAAFSAVPRARPWMACVLLAALVFVTPLGARAMLALRVLGAETREAQWNERPDYRRASFSARDNLRLSQLIARITPPDAQVFLWGYDPMINYVARRKTPSRFLYNFPIAVRWAKASWRKQLLAELTARPPALLVVSSHDATPRVTGTKLDSRALLATFPELVAFVRERYAKPRSVTRFQVYVRQDLSSSVGARLAAEVGK